MESCLSRPVIYETANKGGIVGEVLELGAATVGTGGRHLDPM